MAYRRGRGRRDRSHRRCRQAVTRARAGRVIWQLIRETTAVCFRYRVTGLAAEAGFFALLSLPPLLLGLVGSIGYLGNWVGSDVVEQVQKSIIDGSAQVLTSDVVNDVIKQTLTDVFDGGRFDIISIGFVIALWSGSRALNVFIDTISIMYGLGGKRGIIRTRDPVVHASTSARSSSARSSCRWCWSARRCSASCCPTRSSSSTRSTGRWRRCCRCCR